jgi:hypothetical protein
MRNALIPGPAGIHNEDVDVVHNRIARKYDELANQQQHLR